MGCCNKGGGSRYETGKNEGVKGLKKYAFLTSKQLRLLKESGYLQDDEEKEGDE